MSIFDDFPRGLPGRDERNAPLGTARWSFDAPLWKEGDILLGLDAEGRRVGHNDDRHLITVAGSRAGKGRSVIIPNLDVWPGSCAVLDPKGENATKTARTSGLDWLAFELIDGIKAGRVEEESEEALEDARLAVRSDEQPTASAQPAFFVAPPQPIIGDAQIEWATDYVASRLNDTLGQLDQAIDALDAIAAGDSESPNLGQVMPDMGVTIVLTDGEAPRKARREDAVAAREAIPKLRAALETWSAEVRSTEI